MFPHQPLCSTIDMGGNKYLIATTFNLICRVENKFLVFSHSQNFLILFAHRVSGEILQQKTFSLYFSCVGSETLRLMAPT